MKLTFKNINSEKMSIDEVELEINMSEIDMNSLKTVVQNMSAVTALTNTTTNGQVVAKRKIGF